MPVQVHLVSIRPGDDTTEYHRHIYEEEWLYILSGKGEAVIENAKTGEAEVFEVEFPFKQARSYQACC